MKCHNLITIRDLLCLRNKNKIKETKRIHCNLDFITEKVNEKNAQGKMSQVNNCVSVWMIKLIEL